MLLVGPYLRDKLLDYHLAIPSFHFYCLCFPKVAFRYDSTSPTRKDEIRKSSSKALILCIRLFTIVFFIPKSNMHNRRKICWGLHSKRVQLSKLTLVSLCSLYHHQQRIWDQAASCNFPTTTTNEMMAASASPYAYIRTRCTNPMSFDKQQLKLKEESFLVTNETLIK